MKVKELIKLLADFNPNCEIDHVINPGWYCYDGAEPNGPRDIEQEKLNATHLTLFYGIEGEEKR